jgi:putative endopeptidase
MKLTNSLLLVIGGIIMFTACKTEKDETGRIVFFDKSGMDTTIVPGNDFFSYANGNWVKTTKIPEDQTGWGSFYELSEENQNKTKTILDAASASGASSGSVEQKVGDFYASGIDTVPLKTWLRAGESRTC